MPSLTAKAYNTTLQRSCSSPGGWRFRSRRGWQLGFRIVQTILR